MRITKTMNDINKEKEARKIANMGCAICPSCGNTKILNAFEDACNPNVKGIIKTTFHVTKETLFTYKSGSVDHYRCKKCGTEWESEIY